MRLERIELLDLRLEALAEHLGEAVDARRAAADHDAVDVIGAGRAAEEVEGLLDLEQHVLGDGAEDGPRVLEVDAVDRRALLELLGAVVREVQFLLERLGVGVAANRDVAREQRLLAGDDVDVGRAGAGVDERDDRAGLDVVVGLVAVLQREGVDVDDDAACGRPAG